jgi:hypothetical protein
MLNPRGLFRGLHLWPLIPFLLVYMASCNPDQVVTDPGDALSFSQDTLSFDTLFTNVGSTTAWLKIRNTGSNLIRIRTVRLQSEGSSGFRIRLDGEEQTRFDGVEIEAHDSLYLFVSLKAPVQSLFEPVQIEDAVLFETDGPLKKLVLNAWAWQAEFWRGKKVTADTTLTADRPYVIYDSLVVAHGTTLNIQPGTTLFFHDKAFLKVYGRIVAEGNLNRPVRFRGDRLDQVVSGFPYDFYPGQWGYLQLAPSSMGNVLNYVDIHGANYGIVADSSLLSGLKLKLSNSRIHNMMYSCLWSSGTELEISNSQLTNSGGPTVAVIGGSVRFTHCTIANHQWLATRDGATLVLTNYITQESGADHPFESPLYARFLNTIVSGSQTSELAFWKKEEFGWDVEFDHCFLRSSELKADLATVNSCIYGSDPRFLKLGSSLEKYECDFRIDSLSKVKDAGNTSTLGDYPLDINGLSRSIDGKPDIGAFEWVSGQH